MTKHSFMINSNKIELHPGNQILGRSGDTHLCIGEPSLSSKHLLISNFDEHVEVIDLNSSNGTLINNSRMLPFVPAKINNGDKLTLGKLNIIYHMQSHEGNSPVPSMQQEVDVRGDVTVLAKFDPKQFSVASESTGKDVALIQQTNKRLAFLYSFGQKIGSIFDIRELFKHIIKEIFELFIAADRALVFLLKDGEMRPEIFMKNGKEYPIEQATYSKTIVSMATNEKQGFIASDLGSGHDIDRSKSIVLLNLQCTMIVPFVVDNELFGLLQLDSTRKINAFTEEDLKMLSGISNQVAVNIKNKQLILEMNKQEKIKGSLERYLGPKMVSHLIDNKINLDQQGEERLVSILFSDIRGFTPLSERLKPAQVIEILTIYFSRMTQVIFKYDGFIDKFIGDAIFCIFGIPLFQDNHAELAVKAGIEMQRELAKINEEIFKPMDIQINVGIGINTGNVVYGNIASMERPEVTILGDSVNTSERLCSIAKGGQVLISEESTKYLKVPYEMEKLGLMRLKGKEEKVMVYSLEV
jgi:adenylate cyclase